MKELNIYPIGLGNTSATIKVYIENIPPLTRYQQLSSCHAIQQGEIATIAQQTGNHWRKIFNVYAKLVYQLEKDKVNKGSLSTLLAKYSCWQDFRDGELLQQSSDQCLLFNFALNKPEARSIGIIMGRTYARSLADAGHISIEKFFWLTPEFALNKKDCMIICPYFDYRQLSNSKIDHLVQIIQGLTNKQLK